MCLTGRVDGRYLINILQAQTLIVSKHGVCETSVFFFFFFRDQTVSDGMPVILEAQTVILPRTLEKG